MHLEYYFKFLLLVKLVFFMLFEIQVAWEQGQDLLSDLVHDTLIIYILYLVILIIKLTVLFKTM